MNAVNAWIDQHPHLAGSIAIVVIIGVCACIAWRMASKDDPEFDIVEDDDQSEWFV